MLFDDFDGAVVFDVAAVAFGGEAVEVGACGEVGGVPEVFVAGDVLLVVDAGAPAVVNVELVDGVADAVEEVDDDEAVVDAVAVGGDDVGELEEVVDDEYHVFGGVAALDAVAGGCEVVGEGDEADGVVAGETVVAGVGGVVEGGVTVGEGVDGEVVVAVVLKFPSVLAVAAVGLGGVGELDDGVRYRGVDGFPNEVGFRRGVECRWARLPSRHIHRQRGRSI